MQKAKLEILFADNGHSGRVLVDGKLLRATHVGLEMSASWKTIVIIRVPAEECEIAYGAFNRMETLLELAEDADETIYNIVYRRAGVGIEWATPIDNPDDADLYRFTIYNYYPTLEKAIEGEIERLRKR